MRDTTKYGDYYWCVKVPKTISANGKIYLMADRVVFSPNDAILFVRNARDGEPDLCNLSLAPGQWLAVYAASMIDGSAVAVERWKDEIVK